MSVIAIVARLICTAHIQPYQPTRPLQPAPGSPIVSIDHPPPHTHTHSVRFRPVVSGVPRSSVPFKGTWPRVGSRPSSRLASSDRLPPCQSPLTGRIPSGAVRMKLASQLAEQFIYLFIYTAIYSPHTVHIQRMRTTVYSPCSAADGRAEGTPVDYNQSPQWRPGQRGAAS